MQRDMDLVRKILMAVADAPAGHPPEPLKVEGYTDQQIGYHVMLMAQAGLVDAMNATSSATKGLLEGEDAHLGRSRLSRRRA